MTQQIEITEEMVEAGARGLARADRKDPDAPAWWNPREGAFGVCWRDQYADKSRICLEAALKVRQKDQRP